MALEREELLAFNRGLMSRLGVARRDLNRTAMAAEVKTNWMPRVLGSMMLRPGLGYIGATKSNLVARNIPFVFSTDDAALIEITSTAIRVRIDDTLITRPTVTAAVANGSFTTDVASWTDSDESGATSAWVVGGYLSLIGTDFNSAIRDQEVTVNEANTEHALRVVIQRGPVTLRVGSTAGAEDYVSETTLGTGTHSLAFTPTGNFHIRLSNRRLAASLVDSVTVEAAGTMEITPPWAEADLALVRPTQSGDVVYIACDGYQQRKIERRAARSWSIVLFEPETGPFRIQNVTETTLTPSAISGDITLTASKSIFRTTHVGALFRLASTGQLVNASFTAENQFSDPIRVTGVDAQRIFAIAISGVFTATVTLQYSVGAIGSWVDVTSYAVPTSANYDDTFDNQVIFYRLGVKTGGFTSGTVTASLSFASGSIQGIARVTGYTSGTVVSAAVIDSLGNTTATSDWWEGQWSDYRGWPSAVAFHDGRLCWFGKDKANLSVSDGFEDYDDTTEGDSAPISRSIGDGPVDSINWAVSLSRLLIGTEGAELSVRSSSFEEPLTPTNFNIKPASTQGSLAVAAQRIDNSAVFVHRSGQRLFELSYDPDRTDYGSSDLSLLVPDLNEAGITFVAVQRQPDTRVHCIRADGTVAILVFDRAENVICWVELETDGEVEDCAVLPGTAEDRVYYVVKRTVGGSTVRYLEKWALESECRGGTLNKQADSFAVYSGVATTTPTGFSHLEGESVVVWADGLPVGTKTVSGGTFTLDTAAASVVAGLTYEARYKSMKRAGLNQTARIIRAGLVLADTHSLGLEYGSDFTNMQGLPSIEDGVDYSAGVLWTEYDQPDVEFPGEWMTNARLCLRATAPYPVTVLGVSLVKDRV